MLDDFDMMQALRAIDQRLGLTEVRERPSSLTTTFSTVSDKGTWTPVFQGTTTAGVFTYGTRAATWTRAFNQLFVHGRISISAITTPPVGTMQIAGLPVAAENVAGLFYAIDLGTISNFNYTAAALDLTGRIAAGAQVIDLVESFDNAAAVLVPAANFTNAACTLTFSGFYQLA